MSSIPSSTALLTVLKSRIRSTSSLTPQLVLELIKNLLFGANDKALLPFLPRSLKVLVAFIFLLNWRSWPFLWHYKFLKPVLLIEYAKSRVRSNPTQHRKWLGSIACVGANPFELVTKVSCYAGIDDIDCNGHLSNSSYAKACDGGRMQAPVDVFPCIFTDGCWAALGQTCYYFVREIPYGTTYEVLTNIGAWDDKWMYLFHHFVSYPSKSSKQKHRPHKKPQSSPSKVEAGHGGFAHQDMPSTPSLVDSPPVPGSPIFKARGLPYKPPSSLAKHKVKTALPEGAVIHCVGISSYCFKIGRITVPPSVMFVANGLGDPSKQRWFHVQDLRFHKTHKPASESVKIENKMRDLLKGGWRTDVVDGWETDPTDGMSKFWKLEEYEDMRKENMKLVFDGIHHGLKNLRNKGY